MTIYTIRGYRMDPDTGACDTLPSVVTFCKNERLGRRTMAKLPGIIKVTSNETPMHVNRDQRP